MLRTPIAFALLAFAAPGLAAPATRAATGDAANRSAPRVAAATVRLNAVPGRPAAGYLGIEGGSRADTLVAATAPGTRIELHSMSMAGGVMKMAKLDKVPVAAGTRTDFAPGGNHLMIFGLTGTPATLPITLEFASGARVTTTAKVIKAGEDPAGHDAGHHAGQ